VSRARFFDAALTEELFGKRAISTEGWRIHRIRFAKRVCDAWPWTADADPRLLTVQWCCGNSSHNALLLRHVNLNRQACFQYRARCEPCGLCLNKLPLLIQLKPLCGQEVG